MKTNPITSVLQKVLVQTFYQVNAGLFGVIILIGVGILYPPQFYHRAIMEFIIYSNLGTIGAIIISILYMIKCFRFTNQQFELPQNEFLQNLKLLPTSQRFFQLFVSQAGMMMPILLYSCGIVFIAIQKNNIGFAIGTMVLNLVLTLLSTRIVEYYLQHFNPEKNYLLNGGKHLSLFLLSFLAYNHKMRLFLTKIVSVGALLSVFHFYRNESDIRVPMMAMTVAALAHFGIIFDLRNFEEGHLSFVRNLPVPIWKRFVWNMGTFGAILLLEISIIARQLLNGNLLWSQFVQFIVLGLGLILLIRSILLGSGMNREALSRFVFMIFLFLYFLLFFGMYVPLILIIWAIAFSVFHYNHYKYQ